MLIICCCLPAAVCRADRHRKPLVGNDHHRTGGFFSTGTVIKMSYAVSVATLLVASANLILVHELTTWEQTDPSG